MKSSPAQLARPFVASLTRTVKSGQKFTKFLQDVHKESEDKEETCCVELEFSI